MKQLKKKDEKTVIGDEWSDNTSVEHSCPWCSRVLIKLIDSGGQNPRLFCTACKIEHLPEETRKKSKLGTQRKEVEPAVTSVGVVPDLTKKPVEMRGGFTQLAKKGIIRFIYYHTTEKQ
jgi:hypothetical protein